MNKTLDDYLEQAPHVVERSALLIAETTAMMRLLLADTCECSTEQVSIELAYKAGLEVLRDYRKFSFQERLQAEIKELQPLIEADKAKKEAQRAQGKAEADV